MNNRQYIIEKFAAIVNLAINEAVRVQRTIDKALWNTVASGISKKYKNDFGTTCKPRSADTKEILLQKYVAALIILRQPCPKTDAEFASSKVFPLWAKKLITDGITLNDVTNLYNLNTGKGVSTSPIAPPVTQPTTAQSPIVAPVTKTPIASIDKNNAIKVVVNLRTLIPSTEGGGYTDDFVEELYIPYNQAPERIISVINATIKTYNTPQKKLKCRDGWHSRYYNIDITDPEYNIHTTINIERERTNPRIITKVNNNPATFGMPTYKELYKTTAITKNDPIRKVKDIEEELPKFKVTYSDGNDISNVWVSARDKKDAELKVRREYHDVRNILLISLLKK